MTQKRNHTNTNIDPRDIMQLPFSDRAKIAIGQVLVEKQKSNPTFAWEKFPWKIQFFPLIIKNFRQLGLMQSVNPGMSNFSGMMEIPKSEIYAHLPQKYLPGMVLIKPKTALKEVIKKLKNNKISYPLIAKPNSGERSAGVQYIRNETELSHYAKGSEKPFLIQEFLDFKTEFAIAISRRKNGTFEIYSLVEKRVPIVIGNDQDAIETLINRLSLTIPEKNKIKANASATELKEVLPTGEQRNIVRTASISLGTKVINWNKAITPVLEKEINKVLKNYPGFNAGRFDIKANSIEDIAKGKFRIIELNGINGIPMHVYCDGLSIEEKYEILENYFGRLWKLAERNKEIAPPANLFETVQFFTKSVRNQASSPSLKKQTRRDFWLLFRRLWSFRGQSAKLKIKTTFQDHS